MMSSSNEAKSNRSGVLKTTTWGAVIALSLLVRMGFNGHWTGSTLRLHGRAKLFHRVQRLKNLRLPLRTFRGRAVKDGRSSRFLRLHKRQPVPAASSNAVLSASASSSPLRTLLLGTHTAKTRAHSLALARITMRPLAGGRKDRS